MTQDVMALAEAVKHAELLVPAFAAEEEAHGNAFKVRVIGLRSLLIIGQTELDHARHFAVKKIGHCMASEETQIPGLNTVFPQGTILSCSDCGEGRALQSHCPFDDGRFGAR